MEIIRDRETITRTIYYRGFCYIDEPDAGFSFPCDEHGNIGELNPVAAENLRKCLAGEYEVNDKGIQGYTNRYTEPAAGKCSCGREVTLPNPLDNTCSCGLCYNGSGQEVTPSWLCDAQGNPHDGH